MSALRTAKHGSHVPVRHLAAQSCVLGGLLGDHFVNLGDHRSVLQVLDDSAHWQLARPALPR